MQSNQHAISTTWTVLGSGATVRKPQSVTLDQEIVERGAQALFEFVFSGTERLDGKHLWSNCEEEIRAGFRAEVTAVLEAVWSGLPDG
jgi:hypothetical protein